MNVSAQSLDETNCYKILSGIVVPRPIAWISSLALNGAVNLAPFSCYTFVSTVPPLLAISCGLKPEGPKDTLLNATRNNEFVVNIASYEMLDALHGSSAEFEPDVSEADLFQVALANSCMVTTPRVAMAAASMECKTVETIEFGAKGTQLLIGEVVWFHVRDDVYRNERIYTAAMNPIARVGGPNYAPLGPIDSKSPATAFKPKASAPT